MQLRRILKATTLVGGVVAMLAVSTSALAAEGSDRKLSANERKAIQVVTDFVENLHHKPCKAGSLLADHLRWRAGPDEDIKIGKESAVKFLKSFSDPTSPISKMFQLSSLKVLESTAIGGTGDVLVIQSRNDVFKDDDGKDKNGELVGAFFRVDPRTWKIQEWLDTPINVFTPLGDLPPLPASKPGEDLCPPGAP